MQRLLLEVHHLSNVEIKQAVNLLEKYHAIYRSQRLAERKTRTRGLLPQPTGSQLQQIAQEVNLKPEQTLAQLQNLASRLRQHRIAVRRKIPLTVSLDNPAIAIVVDSQTTADSIETDTEDNWQAEFLNYYRQQFLTSLDTALQQVTQERITHLQRKKPAAVSQFITALHLFHCQAESMGSIAPLVGLQAQYQVTRLLKLKEFRVDVQQQMLMLLKSSILERAVDYTTPQRLATLSQQVESALSEQISEMIQSVSAESSTAKTRPQKSLFSLRLCLILAQLTPRS